MKNTTRKLWMAAVLICCLCPVGFATTHSCRHPTDPGCSSSVPEGGSTAIYLLGAGLICTGAMFLRSRVAKAS
jgi:hypothetical protein